MLRYGSRWDRTAQGSSGGHIQQTSSSYHVSPGYRACAWIRGLTLPRHLVTPASRMKAWGVPGGGAWVGRTTGPSRSIWAAGPIFRDDEGFLFWGLGPGSSGHTPKSEQGIFSVCVRGIYKIFYIFWREYKSQSRRSMTPLTRYPGRSYHRTYQKLAAANKLILASLLSVCHNRPTCIGVPILLAPRQVR